MMKKVNGLAFFDEGPRKDPPLVFIHGFPFNHTMWDPQVKFLSKDHRVISYDLRGHGQSEAGDGQYTLETFVDDLFVLLDHLEISLAVLCGLSMGGYIALRAAERHPHRFSALILCDTKSEPDNNEAKLKRALTLRAVKKDGVAVFSDQFIKTVLAEGSLRDDPGLVGSVLAMIRANSPLGICGALLALAGRTDTTSALPKINLPVLILVGAEDRLTPPAVSESMSKALPQATLRLIPGAGHLSNLENPSFFNSTLIEFLNKL